ncbi:hypothetical protein TNCV_4857841 [Trichonephila clavipes]|nr:hypothetical protein TNCV_4857841 [Trichonephila clavipes]
MPIGDDPVILSLEKGKGTRFAGIQTSSTTNVVMHNATVQQPLKTVSIVMCQAEEGFGSKHNVFSVRYPCPQFIALFTAQTFVVSTQG